MALANINLQPYYNHHHINEQLQGGSSLSAMAHEPNKGKKNATENARAECHR
jgi:hypothetical protein